MSSVPLRLQQEYLNLDVELERLRDVEVSGSSDQATIIIISHLDSNQRDPISINALTSSAEVFPTDYIEKD